MPVYAYSCPSCGPFETVQRITDPTLTTCPDCGSKVRKLIQPIAIAFKGPGFYSNDNPRT